MRDLSRSFGLVWVCVVGGFGLNPYG